MGKYIYFLISVVLCMQYAFAKDDCTEHIRSYFNKNYYYAGGPKAANELTRQRRCLHARNPIYSDAHEFEQKQKYFLSIDDSFLVRKNLIDYQEAAEILADNDNIDESSKYVDKFNDILVQHYDKVLAAKILKEQVEGGLISQIHQKELFEKLDEHLPKLEKCNPGICEGWGLISLVAGAFPKCGENSCQKNINYETLYFNLAQKTDNLPRAAETIKKLLAKDFGTPKSNGEVKAPLMMALYYADYGAFLEESKKFLNKAQKTIKYNYQDAILLPLITQLMIATGEAKTLLPYTKTKHNNIAGLEATLALLSSHLGDSVRQDLRADLETYYELTSACEEYRYEEYNGEKFLRAGTPATLTQNTELDLSLRQRIQAAYWVDDYGGLMENKATNYWCTPSANPEEINTVFASAQIAKQFIKEAFIDDMVLLPLFAFNRIKDVVEGMRQAPQTLRISYYNDALEAAQESNYIKMWVKQNAEEQIYRRVVGQDFMPHYIGDRPVLNIIDSDTWTHGNSAKHIVYRRTKYAHGGPINRTYRDEIGLMGYKERSFSKTLKKAFERECDISLRNIGIDKAYQMRKALGMRNWKELNSLMQDPVLSDIIAKLHPEDLNIIIDKIKDLYDKYYRLIKNNEGRKFTFAYIRGYDDVGFNINNIHLVEEVTEKNKYFQGMFDYFAKEKSPFLSKTWWFSPHNPQETLEGYVAILGCTNRAPCYALFKERETILYLYSHDQSKMIRISTHEYNMSESYLFPHFHYYELGYERSINHMFPLDANDPYNKIVNQLFTKERNKNFKKINQELKELLLPRDEIVQSTKIRVSFE